MEPSALRIVIATFDDEERASRGLAVLSPGLHHGIGMAAVVVRTHDDHVQFIETHDSTAVQGAFHGAGIGAIGGLIGLMFGPLALLGAPIGAGIGALVGRLRDTGFDDGELRRLGSELAPGHSALVATIEAADADQARRLLAELDVVEVVVTELDHDLADALDHLAGHGTAPADTELAERRTPTESAAHRQNLERQEL